MMSPRSTKSPGFKVLLDADTPHFGHIFIIPQGIDYALNHTGEDSLYYGGHRCEM